MTMNGHSIIKRLFGKKCLLIVLCFLMTFFLVGCPAWSDWEYYLPNDYIIFRVNSRNIKLAEQTIYKEKQTIYGKKEYHDIDTVVDNYISEFCYNEQFIAVKQMNPETMNFEDFETNNFESAVFYLVDTSNDDVFGPYQTEAEFNKIIDGKEITNLCQWISTRNNPN